MNVSETGFTSFFTGYFILGILAVIAIVALLAAVVVLIAKIGKVVDGVSAPSGQPYAAAPVYAAQTPASPATAAIRLIDVDDATAAMVMAIVSDETKIPLGKLRFKSIRCVD